MTVKEIINNWDPIDLLSHAPQNEYHSEIKEIEHLLLKTQDCALLSEGIYNIFLNSFSDASFQKTKADCIAVAKKILYYYNTLDVNPN